MVTQLWVRGIWSVGLLAWWAAAAGSAEPPAAEWRAEQLRSQLAEAQRRIHSLYVVYRSERGSYKETEFPAGTYLHRIVAAKAPCSLYHVNAHGHDGLDWHDDPLQQRCRVTAQGWCVSNSSLGYLGC